MLSLFYTRNAVRGHSVRVILILIYVLIHSFFAGKLRSPVQALLRLMKLQVTQKTTDPVILLTQVNYLVSEHRERSLPTAYSCFQMGVVAMRSLTLNTQVPTKGRDADAPRLFSASLNVSKAITLFAFIHSGKNMLVEKHRDEAARMIVFRSAAPYCLNEETAALILDADPEERSAYLIGTAKIAQQFIRYGLYGQVINYFCDKVLTQHNVHPCDEVKLHLGLTGEYAKKSFMDL